MLFPGCRKTGLHVVTTRRLLVISARMLDCLRVGEMGADETTRHRLGWTDEQVQPLYGVDWPLVARQPIRSAEGVLPPLSSSLRFVAAERGSYQLCGYISVHLHGQAYQIGGFIRDGYRGRGLGGELLGVAKHLAHRHFGIARLVAGTEQDNAQALRWLEAAGFTPTVGMPTLPLDSGRVTQAVWREHVDTRPKMRCPWLTETGQARIEGLVPEEPTDYLGWVLANLWRRHRETTDTSCGYCKVPI